MDELTSPWPQSEQLRQQQMEVRRARAADQRHLRKGIALLADHREGTRWDRLTAEPNWLAGSGEVSQPAVLSQPPCVYRGQAQREEKILTLTEDTQTSDSPPTADKARLVDPKSPHQRDISDVTQSS